MSDSYAVRLIRALAACWTAIQHYHPDVPDVVLLPSPSRLGRRRVLGHFAALRWTGAQQHDEGLIHEVAVVAERLDRSAELVFETLLHEAAHARNFNLDIRDCSKSQYHNRFFKVSAELLGLDVAQVDHYGWAHTRMPLATETRFRVEIDAIASVLIHRRGRSLTTTRSRTRSRKATCGCPHIIRASRTVLERTRIVCSTCNEPFREEGDDCG